jgi:hypothetical protein
MQFGCTFTTISLIHSNIAALFLFTVKEICRNFSTTQDRIESVSGNVFFVSYLFILCTKLSGYCAMPGSISRLYEYDEFCFDLSLCCRYESEIFSHLSRKNVKNRAKSSRFRENHTQEFVTELKPRFGYFLVRLFQ